MLTKVAQLVKLAANKIAAMDEEEVKTYVVIVGTVIFTRACVELGKQINKAGVK